MVANHQRYPCDGGSFRYDHRMEEAPRNVCLFGDCREVLATLPAESVNCVVTSPPYWGLRDYGHPGQLGLEATPEEYVANMVEVFREVRRVLRSDGTCWVNLGDSYANDGKWGGASGGKHVAALHGASGIGRGKRATGLKPKDLVGIPWRFAFALQSDGWWLRSEIIWAKPNPMPESVTDRPTRAHEQIFLLTKSARYWYDADAVREAASEAGRTITLGPKSFSKGQAAGAGVPPSGNGAKSEYVVPAGRNRRTVWTVTTKPYSGAHFACFPEVLIKPCILAGCPAGGLVLDPFFGSGTTGRVAEDLGRDWIGIELQEDYAPIIAERTAQGGLRL